MAVHLHPRHLVLARPQLEAALGHGEHIPQAGGGAADQRNAAADRLRRHTAVEQLGKGPNGQASGRPKGQHLLIARGIEPVVATGEGAQPETRQATILHTLGQPGEAPGDLHEPQGQGHGGGILSAHMHQVPPEHPIGIHHEVVEGPPCRGRAGDRLDPVGTIEDRHQAGVGAGLLAQALLLGPHAPIAVEIQADRHGPRVAQALDGLTEQPIIERPAVGGDVELADADLEKRCRARHRPGPQPGRQVIELEIHRLGHQALAQAQQQQGSDAIGNQGRGPAAPMTQVKHRHGAEARQPWRNRMDQGFRLAKAGGSVNGAAVGALAPAAGGGCDA